MAERSKALRFRSQSGSPGVGSNPTSDKILLLKNTTKMINFLSSFLSHNPDLFV